MIYMNLKITKTHDKYDLCYNIKKTTVVWNIQVLQNCYDIQDNITDKKYLYQNLYNYSINFFLFLFKTVFISVFKISETFRISAVEKIMSDLKKIKLLAVTYKYKFRKDKDDAAKYTVRIFKREFVIIRLILNIKIWW